MHDDDVIGTDHTPPPRLAGSREKARGWGLRVGGLLLAAVLLYYPAGMIWIHKIDDDADLDVDVADGESRAVAVAAALIERETDRNRWTANDPFFLPAAVLDNMPIFSRASSTHCPVSRSK